MKIADKDEFEKQNAFGTGTPNTAYAKYFIGESYLNPLTKPEDGLHLLNVTFEPANATEDLDVKWESDDKNVATVTGEGTFTICIHPSTIL